MYFLINTNTESGIDEVVAEWFLTIDAAIDYVNEHFTITEESCFDVYNAEQVGAIQASFTVDFERF